MIRPILKAALAALLMALPAGAQTLAERNEAMFRQMQEVRGVSAAEISRIRRSSPRPMAGWGRATRPSPATP
jgi:phage-related minor tail protein